MRELAAASLARLRHWDISDEQIKALVTSGATRRTLTFRSPVAGVVTEKKAVQGMRFMPGEALYQVADLSSVWVLAEVFEQDIGLVGPGGRATVRIDAYPDKVFQGRVAYIYPTLQAATRTVPVRIELANAGGLLKPGMFAQVELPTASRGAVLTVPTSAVIDGGTRQIVLVQRQEGRFEPRPVKVGARGDDRVEILAGVREGESVVIAANFLIDAESNLKAAIDGFGNAGSGVPAPAGAGKPAAGVGHRAEGRVEELDSRSDSVTIAHAPVASLNWPAMSMEFKLAHGGLRPALQPGATVAFEFVERGPGEWVITAVTPAAKAENKGTGKVGDNMAHTVGNTPPPGR
jgi:Cu(I)/Ag(I) efflux system membrane fusion protein/cobalt-zinc-cadmium efflux system membrane fusion protein